MMKDHRHGEHLWVEWSGEGYEPLSDAELVFYTEEVVDLEVPLIRKALASSLQREGVADSLSDGHKLIEASHTVYGFVGYMPEDITHVFCNEAGVANSGEQLESVTPCTWVELPGFS
jgi:hypothetical protein